MKMSDCEFLERERLELAREREERACARQRERGKRDQESVRARREERERAKKRKREKGATTRLGRERKSSVVLGLCTILQQSMCQNITSFHSINSSGAFVGKNFSSY